MNEAKEIFFKYCGSYFHMERDGQLTKYKGYNVDTKTEKEWLKELQKEILEHIKGEKSIEVYLSQLSRLMYGIKDDEYLEQLFNLLIKDIEKYDTFIKLRIAEELQEVIKKFISNNIGNREKLANYKKQIKNILTNVISQPFVISEDTKKNIAFEDTIKEEKIKERAKQRLMMFE